MLAKIATLSEIRYQWRLSDLLDAHEALDIADEAKDYAYEKARQDVKDEAARKGR